MDAVIYRDGFKYTLHFEKGENVGGLKKEKIGGHLTGTEIKWRPDMEVFTDINIPTEYFKDTLKRQAIVNAGLTFVYKDKEADTTEEFVYPNGIKDYITELNAGKGLQIFSIFQRKPEVVTERISRNISLSLKQPSASTTR